jgi:hypothetical protein
LDRPVRYYFLEIAAATVDKQHSCRAFSPSSLNAYYDLFGRPAAAGLQGRRHIENANCVRAFIRLPGNSPLIPDKGATVLRLIRAGALTAAAVAAFASLAYAEPLHLASHYSASGSNPDGSQYTGSADVNVISDTTFSIVWKIQGERYEGFGMRLNDSLAATYMINGEPGLIIYKVDGNGLTGAWAIRGHDGVGTEHLRPLN